MKRGLIWSAAGMLLGVAAVAGELRPIFDAADLAFVGRALGTLGASTNDAGFRKDVGEPLYSLALPRRLLEHPWDLPGEADRIRAACDADSSDALWTLAGRLLETDEEMDGVRPRPVIDPDGAGGILRNTVPNARPASGHGFGEAGPTGAPSDMSATGESGGGAGQSAPLHDLDPRLRKALSRFMSDTAELHGELADIAAHACSNRADYAIASLLASTLNAEDHPERGAQILRCGIASNVLQQVLRAALDFDPRSSSTQYLHAVRTFPLARALEAGRRLRDAIGILEREVAGVDWPLRAVREDTPWGRVWVGSTNADTYSGPCLLIVEPAGADQYGTGTGAANGLRGVPLAAVLDLGGNDHYLAADIGGPASGVAGVGVVVDRAGNDTYEGGHVGMGAGLFGVGWLEDGGGEDHYRGGALGMGSGVAGFGLLWDQGGNDRYAVGLCGQGFAGVRGLGVLLDEAGNDVYGAGGFEHDFDRNDTRFLAMSQGFAIGLRPYAGGGWGILADRSGNDTYAGDVYGQGASYWCAAGLLLDEGGDDTYRMHQYGQGAGIHLSVGLLADGAGNDRYAGHALMQGAAHDYAVGMLVDRAGEDAYEANHFSQARGMNNAFALLLDGGGDDRYAAGEAHSCQAACDNGSTREYGSLAVLADLGGADAYSCGATNGAELARPFYGVVSDWGVSDPAAGPRLQREASASGSLEPAVPGRTTPSEVGQPPAPLSPSAPMATLVFHAQRFGSTPEKRRRREEARAAIFARGEEALDYLMPLTDLDNDGIHRLVEELTRAKLTSDVAVPILLKYVDADKVRVRKTAVYFLGFHDAGHHADRVMPLLQDEPLAGVAMRTLGKWRAKQALDGIAAHLKDPEPRRRILAVNALGDLGLPEAEPLIRAVLKDEDFLMRKAAERAVERLLAR